MNADKDRLDSLTERVLGAVFEVTNTLGRRIPRDGLPAGAAYRTRPPGYRRSFVYGQLKESLCWWSSGSVSSIGFQIRKLIEAPVGAE